jgi:hypothetical protein
LRSGVIGVSDSGIVRTYLRQNNFHGVQMESE